MTWTAIRRVLPTGAGPFATQQQPMHEHVWLPGSVGGAVVSEVAACGIVCDAIACAVIVADTIAPDVACTIECGASAATACCAGLPCPPCTGHSWIPPALHIASAKHGERKSPRRRRNQVWRIPDVKAPLSGRQCDAPPGDRRRCRFWYALCVYPLLKGVPRGRNGGRRTRRKPLQPDTHGQRTRIFRNQRPPGSSFTRPGRSPPTGRNFHPGGKYC